jgi:hypothetical protein
VITATLPARSCISASFLTNIMLGMRNYSTGNRSGCLPSETRPLTPPSNT